MSKEIENKNKREVDMMKYMFKITRKDYDRCVLRVQNCYLCEMKNWIDF